MQNISKALIWDEVANDYDKLVGGRRARTLPMDEVFDALAARTEEYYVHPDDGTIHRVEKGEAS